MNQTPIRPALKYYGGKWDLGPWVISHFPIHDIYVEAFGGALSVLLQKAPVTIEVANDLNGRVMTFFQMVRDRPEDLVRAIQLTPYHQGEYDLALEVAEDPLEEARRFFTLCWVSLRGGPGPSHFRLQKNLSRGRPCVKDLECDQLWAVSDRLKNVQFMAREALEVVDKFRKEEGALLYLDPPYVKSARVKVAEDHYGDQDQDDSFHDDLAQLVDRSAAMVVISGRGDTYDQLLPDWGKVVKTARQNWGGTGEEALWLNPRAITQLQRPVQLSMWGQLVQKVVQ